MPERFPRYTVLAQAGMSFLGPAVTFVPLAVGMVGGALLLR